MKARVVAADAPTGPLACGGSPRRKAKAHPSTWTTHPKTTGKGRSSVTGDAGDFTGRTSGSPRFPFRPRLALIIGRDVRKWASGASFVPRRPRPLRPVPRGLSSGGAKVERNLGSPSASVPLSCGGQRRGSSRWCIPNPGHTPDLARRRHSKQTPDERRRTTIPCGACRRGGSRSRYPWRTPKRRMPKRPVR
jgi:hypothetical protein